MRFNHDAQLLAIASDAKKDNMRMVRALLCVCVTGTDCRMIFTDPSSVDDCVLELAKLGHTAWYSKYFGLLTGKRICRSR
jgi:hypothetical protein